jgi:hypothetical protein
MAMKIEITLTQWTVIKGALEDDIKDFRQTAELDTATEQSRKFLHEAADRREQVLKDLQEQINNQF